VEYLDSTKPNEATVESIKTEGARYIVRNIYSLFPSCSCQYSFEGNFCKHQIKALLDREHKAGVIVAGVGMYLGSHYAGVTQQKIEPSTPLMDIHSPVMLTPDQSAIPNGTSPALQLAETFAFLDHTPPGSGHSHPQFSTPPGSPATPHTLDNMIQIFRDLVTGNHQVMQTALNSVMRGISDITLLKQTQVKTGKDFVQPLDSFVIPKGLTKKRQLGAVDFYHGGRKGKRVYPEMPQKNRKPFTTSSPAAFEVYFYVHKPI
jgi:hypothetical protein